MKKLFLFCILIFMMPIVLGAGMDTTKNTHYYMFDYDNTTQIDSIGSEDGTVTGASSVVGIISNAYDFEAGDGNNDIAFSDPILPVGAKCISFWVKAESLTALNVVMENNQIGGEIGTFVGISNVITNRMDIFEGDGSGLVGRIQSTTTIPTGSWSHWVYSWDGSTDADAIKIYYNGGIDNTATASDYQHGVQLNNLNIGSKIGATNFWDGLIDEVNIFNRSCNSTEPVFLYNGGTPTTLQQYPYTGVGPADSVTYSETANASMPENTRADFDINISWLGYNVSSSTTEFFYNALEYSTELLSSSYGVDGFSYFNTSITTPYIIVNSTSYPFLWRYNITLSNGSILNFSSVLNNQTIVWNYDRLNITRVYNLYTGDNITNFTGNISNGVWSANFSTNESFVLVPLVNGTDNYTVYVEALGYAIANNTNYQTLVFNQTNNITTVNMTFGLYTNNSVLVYVYDEETTSLIISNVTLTVTGNGSEDIYNFANGIYLITDLNDGLYNFKFAGGNYTTRTYAVTVASRSFQTLSAYLTPTVFNVIFTVLDYDSSATIESASITMSRLLNSSWVIVESKNSDITGRAQFSYIQNILYRFYVSKTGFTPKTFDLDPILFSSYNIRLNQILSDTDPIDYSSVSIEYAPKNFYNDEINNFTIFFASPTGSFISYSYNVSYPSNSSAGSGTNAVGENFAVSLNITGANYFDTVNITYTYNVTVGEPRTYNFIYYIIGSDQGNNTFIENQEKTFGLGILERVLISTILIIVVSGSVALFLGGVVALIIGLIFMGLLTVIGFYPLWLYLIALAGGFFIIIKNS